MDRKIKLLVVDDESRFLSAIAARLRKRGFDVHAVTNGKDAIAMAQCEPFDLAIVDLKMPGMGGGEVLRALKEQQQFIEAVILTGHGSLESAVALTELGAFGYLPKPYELDKLIDTLVAAYATSLKKKFAADKEKMDRIGSAAEGASPLAALETLRTLDDGR